MSQRQQHRSAGSTHFAPVLCHLSHGGRSLALDVVNYHFRGACLRFREGNGDATAKALAQGGRLSFHLGNERLKADIAFRVVWEDAREGHFGVEFLEERHGDMVERAQRLLTHSRVKPTLTATDPLDPHRRIFFVVEDMSPGGMQVSTSLSNRHLFPGMELREAELAIPGAAPLTITCGIQNTRPQEGTDHFRLGLALTKSEAEYRGVVAQYLIGLGEGQAGQAGGAGPAAVAAVNASFGKTKALQRTLTFRVCADPADYEKVLRLRFMAYGSKGKLGETATWQSQGEGMDREGHILMCLLGGRLVATAELRIGTLHRPFRSETIARIDQLDGVSFAHCMEVNKLAVHPDVQSTDVLMGMFQKIHAHAVLHRVQKTVLLATDQLRGLYLRLGARDFGIRFPHPDPRNGFLNILAIDEATFNQGEGLNPLAWQMIYGGISSYMAEKGVAKGRRFAWPARVRMAATRVAMTVKGRGKKVTATAVVAPEADAPHAFLDPRWTKPHFASEILAPFLREADAMAGPAKTEAILAGLGVTRAAVSTPGTWFSVAFFDAFLDGFAQHGSVAELCRRAGRYAMSREALGIQHFLIRHLASPEKALAGIQKIASRFNQTRFFQVETKGPAHLRLSLGLTSPELLPRHRESCQNWLACLEEAMAIFADYHCHVHKTACCYDGDAFCSYDIDWKKRKSPWRWALGALAMGAASAGIPLAWPSAASSPWLALGGLGLTTAVAGAFWWQHRRHAAAREMFAEQFARFKSESIERYRELQQSREKQDKRYRELKVLERAVKLIQEGSDLQDILQRTLRVTSEHFQFDRAFVMLKDEQGKFLRTAAMDGIERGAELIWRFKVAIDAKRDNPAVLSSVFHSGTSILVPDVEKHLFQLNAESRQILHELGSQAFIITPIKSAQTTWGIIAADRKSRDLPLDRYEVVLLERVANHLGLALDKEAKIQREQNLRRVFQKYVPAHVLDEGSGRNDPVIGGQTKTVACFFIDIRAFTRMGELLPPETTLTVLNRFFDLCQRVIAQHAGCIDKFLGDGLLATWGAVPGSQPDPEALVGAALAILVELEALNGRLRREGLKPLEVGIGAHWGDCIVGNVGSQERMEFTCIGRTVNMAARLEGLCKEFNTNLIVSQALRDALPARLQARFAEVHGVSIRGIEGQVGVACLMGGDRENAITRAGILSVAS